MSGLQDDKPAVGSGFAQSHPDPVTPGQIPNHGGRAPKGSSRPTVSGRRVDHLGPGLVRDNPTHRPQQGVARRVVPRRRGPQGDLRSSLSCRDLGQPMGDAGHIPKARRQRAGAHPLGIALGVARNEDDVTGGQRLWEDARHRPPVHRQRSAPLRPGVDRSRVVGVPKGEHDAEDRYPVHEEADGDTAATMAAQVVSRAVVGIDEPHRSRSSPFPSSRFFAEVSMVRKRIEKNPANDFLGLDVCIGLVP